MKSNNFLKERKMTKEKYFKSLQLETSHHPQYHNHQQQQNNQKQNLQPTPKIQASSSSSSSGASSSYDALGVTILLSDWSQFGLYERALYHFELMESSKDGSSNTASTSGQPRQRNQRQDHKLPGDNNSSDNTKKERFCGVVKLLECIPAIPLFKQPQKPKRNTSELSRKGRNNNRDKSAKGLSSAITGVAMSTRATHHALATNHQKCTSSTDLDIPGKRGKIFKNIASSTAGDVLSRSTSAIRSPSKSMQNTNNTITRATNNNTQVLRRGNDELRVNIPKRLPMTVTSNTRVNFAYDFTRIAFVLDASPTLTYSINNSNTNNFYSACCALDNLSEMVTIYFTNLIEAVTITNEQSWVPKLAVTVLAVYSGSSNSNNNNTSVLVKDFRVEDVESAKMLSKNISYWAKNDVEDEIASRMIYDHRCNINSSSSFTSYLYDLLLAADIALETLPREGRPFTVIATDCRSVICDSIMDVLTLSGRNDVPIHVLDLSSSSSKRTDSKCNLNNKSRGSHSNNRQSYNHQPSSSSTFDYWYDDQDFFGISTSVCTAPMLPIHITNDMEALYNICAASSGCFLTYDSLYDATTTYVGQINATSIFSCDYYATSRRRALRPNLLQWYTLFSMSPFTIMLSSKWSTFPPPAIPNHISTGRLWNYASVTDASFVHFSTDSTYFEGCSQESKNTMNTTPRHSSRHQSSDNSSHNTSIVPPLNPRTIFSSYTLTPVRLAGILWMRILEGFKIKQYNLVPSAEYNKPSRVSIHLSLMLEFGTTLHYEFSFFSLPDILNSSSVGNAHVKVELSGDPKFIVRVKNDFISYQIGSSLQQLQQQQQIYHHQSRYGTNANYNNSCNNMNNNTNNNDLFTSFQKRDSAKICKFFLYIQKEDMLESLLCPTKWNDKILNEQHSTFLKRMKSLTSLQKQRHFGMESIDVACIGNINVHKSTTQELFECVSTYCTATIKENQLFIKTLSSTINYNTPYCIVEMKQSCPYYASRLYNISIGFFGIDTEGKISTINNLKLRLSFIPDIVMLPPNNIKNLMNVILVATGGNNEDERVKLQKHHYSCNISSSLLSSCYYIHQSWELTYENKLFQLLVKKRQMLEKWWMIDYYSDNNENDDKDKNNNEISAKFVKFISKPSDLLDNTTITNKPVSSPSYFTSKTTGNHDFVPYCVQYHLHSSFKKRSIIVHVYIDTPKGAFFPSNISKDNKDGCFHSIHDVLETKDYDCSNALQSRHRLLSLSSGKRDKNANIPNSPITYNDIQNLIFYGSKYVHSLNFFDSGLDTANDILTEFTSSFLSSFYTSHNTSNTLSIRKILPLDQHLPTSKINNLEPGSWFLMQYHPDKENNLCLVHLSAVSHHRKDDKGEQFSSVYRNICCFMSTVEDLHYNRMTPSNQYTEQPDILSMLFQKVNDKHCSYFSQALYLALLEDQTKIVDIHPNDWKFALSMLSFVQVIDVSIDTSFHENNKDDNDMENSSLWNIIDKSNLLQSIRMKTSDKYFYFPGGIDKKIVLLQSMRQNIREQELRLKTLSTENDDKDEDDDSLMDLCVSFDTEEGGDGILSSENDDIIIDSSDLVAILDASVDSSLSPNKTSTPIFIKIKIDGNEACVEDLDDLCVDKSRISDKGRCRLQVYISIFTMNIDTIQASLYNSPQKPFPLEHAVVALALNFKIHSLISCQTFRKELSTLIDGKNETLSNQDLKRIYQGLIESDSVVAENIAIGLYSMKSDSILLMSTKNLEVLSEELSLLLQELISGLQIDTIPTMISCSTNNVWILTNDETSSLSLLKVNKKLGHISIHVYDFYGTENAKMTLDLLVLRVKNICHKVNQLLLLQSLHLTRHASRLLIPDNLSSSSSSTASSNSQSAKPSNSDNEVNEMVFPPGHFACSIMFQTSIHLFHRISVNKAILSLESEVLHPFAISNRRGFVYKDEIGHIFYMKFKSQTSEQEEKEVELEVYGIHDVGPCIAIQMKRLMQKQMAVVSIDVLSSILMKNPQFSLLYSDISFLKTFESFWIDEGDTTKSSIDNDNDTSITHQHCRTYKLPESVHDPIMVLLYFRQNFCGSSFVHQLNETSASFVLSSSSANTSEKQNNNIAPNYEYQEEIISQNGLPLQYDPSQFVFHYNHCPSPLNPDIQPTSTLTEKGKELTRNIGNGIAIFQMGLLDSLGNNIDILPVGRAPHECYGDNPKVPLSELKISHLPKGITLKDKITLQHNQDREGVEIDASNAKPWCYLRVNIINTTIKLQPLFELIELTFNQGLLGWIVEQRLECSRLRFANYSPITKDDTLKMLNNSAVSDDDIEVDVAATTTEDDIQNIAENAEGMDQKDVDLSEDSLQAKNIEGLDQTNVDLSEDSVQAENKESSDQTTKNLSEDSVQAEHTEESDRSNANLSEDSVPAEIIEESDETNVNLSEDTVQSDGVSQTDAIRIKDNISDAARGEIGSEDNTDEDITSSCEDKKQHDIIKIEFELDNKTKIDAASVESLVPNLLPLFSILQSSISLPSPAIHQLKHTSEIPCAEIAMLTLTLLERAIISPLFGEKQQCLVADGGGICSDFSILCLPTQSEGSTMPKAVTLSRTSSYGNDDAEVFDVLENKNIPISSTDPPTFICTYGLSRHYQTKENDNKETNKNNLRSKEQKVFREVMISDPGTKNNAFSHGLVWLKKYKKSAFDRSLVFILIVSRSCRTLLTYNWHPQLIQEAHSIFCQIEEDIFIGQQQLFNVVEGNTTTKKDLPPLEQSRKLDSDIKTETTTTPIHSTSTTTPTITKIRKPKLIGKSVNGSAEHAQLLARARASHSSKHHGLLHATATTGMSAPSTKLIKRHPSRERLTSLDGRSSFFGQQPLRERSSTTVDNKKNNSFSSTSNLYSEASDDISEVSKDT